MDLNPSDYPTVWSANQFEGPRMTIEQAIRADFDERLTKKTEPLDPMDVELLMSEMERIAGRMTILCNTLLNQPQGLPDGAIQATQNIKIALTQIRCYIAYPERGRRV